MKLVTVEHLLGGERIIFYFLAEHRVDFRELVHRLASQYHTRIEMRQVGARDEARLVGDYERCGQVCCCKEFLKGLQPVSMRMAKTQKATLDPSKISGRCGRLMCCLRYEDDCYRDLKKRLPHKNIWVRTDDLVGRVVATQILTQLVQVQLPNNSRVVIANEDIIERNVEPPEVPETAPPKAAKRTAATGDDRKTKGRAKPPATDKPAPEKRKRPPREQREKQQAERPFAQPVEPPAPEPPRGIEPPAKAAALDPGWADLLGASVSEEDFQQSPEATEAAEAAETPAQETEAPAVEPQAAQTLAELVEPSEPAAEGQPQAQSEAPAAKSDQPQGNRKRKKRRRRRGKRGKRKSGN